MVQDIQKELSKPDGVIVINSPALARMDNYLVAVMGGEKTFKFQEAVSRNACHLRVNKDLLDMRREVHEEVRKF